MNKYLVEGMDKFLAKYKTKDKKELKESLDDGATVYSRLPEIKEVMKFFVSGKTSEKFKAAKEVINAMKDEIMEAGYPEDMNFYKKDENIKEFIFDMQDNTGKFGHLLGDEEELDESCKKQLKESSGEALTKEDIDKFFTDFDKKIRRRIRFEIKHGDYGDYDMWDAIEDELYESNPKDFTPEIEKYFKKRIWQIIDEYEGTNYAEEEEIDSTYHDASEEELRKMGAFDNLNDEEELDEGCKKPLNEDSILDRINKYLDSIGEAPITESKDEDKEEEPTILDQLNTYLKSQGEKPITITESKKPVKKAVKVSESLNKCSVHPGNLFESLNKGFEKLYGKVEDPILENKYSSSKKKTINESLDNENLTDEEKKDNETFVKLFRRLRSTHHLPLTQEMEDLLDKYGLELYRYSGINGEVQLSDQSNMDVSRPMSTTEIWSTGSTEGDRKVNWVDKIKKMRERNPKHIFISSYSFDREPHYSDDRYQISSAPGGSDPNKAFSYYSNKRYADDIESNAKLREIRRIIDNKNAALKDFKSSNPKLSNDLKLRWIQDYNDAVDSGFIKKGKKIDTSELPLE